MANIILGPATVNLVGIVENDAWSAELVLTSDGVPVDLTGLAIVAKIITDEQSYPITATVTSAVDGRLTISQNDAPKINVAQWAMRIGTRTYFEGSVTGKRDVLA